MKGIIAAIVLGVSFSTDKVFSQSVISSKLVRNGKFDGYLGGMDGFEQLTSRSKIDCARQCAKRIDCMNNMYDPETMRCHLFTNLLTRTAGLTPTPGATCHSKVIVYGGVPFQCPPDMSDYQIFELVDGTYTQIRVVNETRVHASAIEDCVGTGGRLMAISTAEKKDLVENITECLGSGFDLTVDGTNVDAANFSDVDAYTTQYGEVITVGELLWYLYPNETWQYYRPTTEHCLMYHTGHHHTFECTVTWPNFMYFCEKDAQV